MKRTKTIPTIIVLLGFLLVTVLSPLFVLAQDNPWETIIDNGSDPWDTILENRTGERSMLSPAEVVEEALQAQAKGDLAGFFSRCAIADTEKKELDTSRKVLKIFADKVKISNFTFTAISTGKFRDNTVAIVRAMTRYRVNNNDNVENGLLVYLKKDGDQWKIVRIFPDELLNLQIYEDSLPEKNENTFQYSTLRNNRPPIHLRELNEKLNKWLVSPETNGRRGNWEATVWGGGFMVIGAVPGVGDAIAIPVQLCETAWDAGEAVKECYEHGPSPILAGKLTEVGIGLFRVAVEVVPKLDMLADVAGIAAANMTHNLEQQRALRKFRYAFLGVSVKETGIFLHPFLTPDSSYSYPKGLLSFDKSSSSEYSVISGINILNPEWIGTTVPLRIYGRLDFKINSPLWIFSRHIEADAALALGGKKILLGNTVRLYVDITQMFETITDVGSLHLPEYSIPKYSNSGPMFFKITCLPVVKKQKFSIDLSNGEETQRISVSTIMDDIGQIMSPEIVDDEGRLGITVGKSINFDMYAQYKDEEVRLKPECFLTRIHDEGIVSLKASDTFTVKGLKKGDTRLDIVTNENGQGEEEFVSFDIIVCPAGEALKDGECVGDDGGFSQTYNFDPGLFGLGCTVNVSGQVAKVPNLSVNLDSSMPPGLKSVKLNIEEIGSCADKLTVSGSLTGKLSDDTVHANGYIFTFSNPRMVYNYLPNSGSQNSGTGNNFNIELRDFYKISIVYDVLATGGNHSNKSQKEIFFMWVSRKCTGEPESERIVDGIYEK